MIGETREGQPIGRNILTDQEGVLRDIAEIEGIPEVEASKVQKVLDWTNRPGARGSHVPEQLYGVGGTNRWYVYADGEVVLAQSYRSNEQAKAKGFRILEEIQGLKNI